MKSDKPIPQPTGKGRNPWSWIPTAYLAEGLPNVLVMTVAGTMLFQLGVSLSQIGVWTSLLGFAWTVKPLWGPLIERYWSKRRWVILMQLLMGASLLGLGFVLQTPFWWYGTLMILGAVALFSATNDIATDGYYMDALSEKDQSFFVGIRSTFYRIAMIIGQGVLLIIAGFIVQKTGPDPVEFQVFAGPAGVERVIEAPQQTGQEFVKFDPPVLTMDAGTTAAIAVSLAAPPEDTTRTVTLRRNVSSLMYEFFPVGTEHRVTVDRDKEVLHFNQDNWSEPQLVTVEVHENLDQAVTANFRASSGNLRLTWALCFGGIGIVLMIFSLYHWLVMPKPLADRQHDDVVVPFRKALGIMALVILIPLLAYWGLLEAIRYPLTTDIPVGLVRLISITIAVAVVAFLFVIKLDDIRRMRQWVTDKFVQAAQGSQVPFNTVFSSFFQKKNIGIMLTFLLVYRLGEGLLTRMAQPFMLAPVAEGGLGLSVAQVGLAYGTFGTFAMLIGGILGGVLASRHGLKRWIWVMIVAINLPNALYVFLATAQPESFAVILSCVATESFGYGFGFSAYMMYMLYIAGSGEYKTSHFALCTGFMSLGMLVPGMVSGDLAEALDWKLFFVLTVVVTIPGFIVLAFLPLDKDFGRGNKEIPVDAAADDV